MPVDTPDIRISETEDIFRITAVGLDWDIGVTVYEPTDDADIATMPFGVMDKFFNHPLTDIGMEGFSADWEAYQQALAKKRS